MSSIKVYSYAKCTTCKKAAKFLKHHGIEFKQMDIVESPPTKKELKSMLASYEGNLKKLFNTSGILYREMKMSEQLKNMSEKEALQLLSEHGKLVKRPFVLIEANIGLVGFKEDEWLKAFDL